jgi:hypothetical protein
MGFQRRFDQDVLAGGLLAALALFEAGSPARPDGLTRCRVLSVRAAPGGWSPETRRMALTRATDDAMS